MSEHTLTVTTADPSAEVMIYDGRFDRVGHAVGGYSARLPDGLYQVRARTGGNFDEKLVSLSGDLTVTFEAVEIRSPVPLANTLTSHETHQQAVVAATQTPVKRGTGSGLLIVARDWSAKGRNTPESPAGQLSLYGPKGERVSDLGAEAPVDRRGHDAAAAICFEVEPGAYRLRLDLPDGGSRERALVATKGWTTQIFLLRRPYRDAALLPDLAQGSISLARLGSVFSPEDARTRLGEVAREALTNNRPVTASALLALQQEKFQDPILGLLVAHLLRRDTPKDPILGVVLDNLTHLLGADHPDVKALLPSPTAFVQMPMLRASWDLMLAKSVAAPQLMAAGALPATLSRSVLTSSPWLVWESPETTSTRRGDAKMAALRDYVARRASETAMPAMGLEAMAVDPAPLSLTESAQTSLDTQDRLELSQGLGIPSDILDEMLSNLDS